jgi:hypothetical protein
MTSTFGLWAFGVFCGAVAMWLYYAYKETKDAAGIETQRGGGHGEE